MHRATNERMLAGAMMEIDVDGLDLLKDENCIIGNLEEHPSWVYFGIISPKRFIRISVSTNKKPCNFNSFQYIFST